jgi:hypothetical protein
MQAVKTAGKMRNRSLRFAERRSKERLGNAVRPWLAPSRRLHHAAVRKATLQELVVGNAHVAFVAEDELISAISTWFSASNLARSVSVSSVQLKPPSFLDDPPSAQRWSVFGVREVSYRPALASHSFIPVGSKTRLEVDSAASSSAAG